MYRVSYDFASQRIASQSITASFFRFPKMNIVVMDDRRI